MNLKLNHHLKNLLLTTETVRRVRRVACRFALHETGSLLCACAPLVHRAGEKLQHLSNPTPAPSMPQRSSSDQSSSFDF